MFMCLIIFYSKFGFLFGICLMCIRCSVLGTRSPMFTSTCGYMIHILHMCVCYPCFHVFMSHVLCLLVCCSLFTNILFDGWSHLFRFNTFPMCIRSYSCFIIHFSLIWFFFYIFFLLSFLLLLVLLLLLLVVRICVLMCICAICHSLSMLPYEKRFKPHSSHHLHKNNNNNNNSNYYCVHGIQRHYVSLSIDFYFRFRFVFSSINSPAYLLIGRWIDSGNISDLIRWKIFVLSFTPNMQQFNQSSCTWFMSQTIIYP